jgi:O-methyltransferase involved in polyketide biosynthesis
MDNSNHKEGYFNTVSPSARVLLFLKANTDLPYAKQAAALLAGNPPPEESYRDSFSYWARVVHMEQRYKSINRLLTTEPVSNILELSSGFSFRGLDAVVNDNVHYIDTDLPAVIESKIKMVESLQVTARKGLLELLPLNVMDEDQFENIASRFASGPLAIVNEGLLMYLDRNEKSKLCSTIHNILKDRQGYWITADIYPKNELANNALRIDDPFQRFLDAHQVEEKKFESEEDARSFFESHGFTVEREAEPDYPALSAFSELVKRVDPARLEAMGRAGKIHATWKLRVN